jgi:hypothetical protein
MRRLLLAGLFGVAIGCATHEKEVVERPAPPPTVVVTPAPQPQKVEIVTPPPPPAKVIVVPNN